MKSIIQEVHEGLTENEKEEMERLAVHRGVCTCALLKGWLISAFRRLEAEGSGAWVTEQAVCPRCAAESARAQAGGGTGASGGESVLCVAALDEAAVQSVKSRTL